MAISFLSSGVIWRLVYQDDPRLGLANAALVSVSEIIQPPGPYPTARPSRPDVLVPQAEAYVTAADFEPGSTTELGLIAVPPRLIPVSYTHLRAHETVLDLVCRLLLEKQNTHHPSHSL